MCINSRKIHVLPLKNVAVKTKAEFRGHIHLFTNVNKRDRSRKEGVGHLQIVDDGPVLETLDVFFCLVEARPLLCFGRRAFHQLDKIVAVNFVHDAEHAPAVVADALQVHPFTRERRGCGGGRMKRKAVTAHLLLCKSADFSQTFNQSALLLLKVRFML